LLTRSPFFRLTTLQGQERIRLRRAAPGEWWYFDSNTGLEEPLEKANTIGEGARSSRDQRRSRDQPAPRAAPPPRCPAAPAPTC